MSDIPIEYTSGLEEVKTFRYVGKFPNNIDSFGNFQLIYGKNTTDDGKYNYTCVPLKTLKYNEDKIKDTSDVSFSELETLEKQKSQDIDLILKKYNESIEENRILNETVNSLVEKYENSDDKQIIEAMKTEIINLRIKLGQGNLSSDFSDDFPFLPLE